MLLRGTFILKTPWLTPRGEKSQLLNQVDHEVPAAKPAELEEEVKGDYHEALGKSGC